MAAANMTAANITAANTTAAQLLRIGLGLLDWHKGVKSKHRGRVREPDPYDSKHLVWVRFSRPR